MKIVSGWNVSGSPSSSAWKCNSPSSTRPADRPTGQRSIEATVGKLVERLRPLAVPERQVLLWAGTRRPERPAGLA